MEMTEIFDKLKELQEILKSKYEIEKEIVDAPKQLTSQEELLARLQTEFIEKNEKYEEKRTRILALKTELAETESKRENSEKAMDNISTHREYEILEKEIKDATDAEQRLRKDLQKEEKDFADLDENLKHDEQFIEQQKNELLTRKEQMEQEINSYRQQLDELKNQEDKITPGIDPETIFKFERIIKSKHLGIVSVKGNVCDGCHMILPAQFANDVHAGEKIMFCPYCSRILVYEPNENGESEFFRMEDTGSLIDDDDESSFDSSDDGFGGNDYDDEENGRRTRDDYSDFE